MKSADLAHRELIRYLLQFEEQVMAHGGHVFWVANGEEACTYVKDLATRLGVRTVVKSKSMVTEEIHLSPALENAGIKVWETDFGEFIRSRTATVSSHPADRNLGRSSGYLAEWRRALRCAFL